jgi:meso-butanediol dehydrogenase/(S,S)-butanediol dehydrogenase/diacetyl reductase
MQALGGKIAVVTGGTSGIGAATAARLKADGASVIALDLKPPEEGLAFGEFRRLDVTRRDDAQACVSSILQDHGRIDILVNCAGVGSVTGAFQDLDLEVWDRVMAVNFMSVAAISRMVMPSMCARGSGSVVNVASTFGLLARRNAAPYSVSKAAVIHLTKCMAIDLGETGVRVNCVCPGLIDTPMTAYLNEPSQAASRDRLKASHAMNRLGEAREVAEAIAFLASDAAAYITGQALAVDGGYTAGKWTD